MRLTLKDFQAAAVEKLVAQLRASRRDARMIHEDQAVILASPTGSGKTIVATAAIERLIFGQQDAPPDPRALVLWITDQPELNEQTRRKMLSSSSQLGPDKLAVIDSTFDERILKPGKVYFLNTQKLGVNALLVKAGDERHYTFWEIVDNTIADEDLHLYVVIDEAHRGMVESRIERDKATSIMQRFIKGGDGMRPSPVVLGVSATPRRFLELLAGSDRTVRQVVVKPEDVRESGLIKEKVVVFHPVDTQPADVTLLREAARDWVEAGSRWKAYCESQGEEDVVRPLLIVQVEDGGNGAISRTDMAEAIAAIRSVVGRLPDAVFGHAFQEKTALTIGSTGLRYIAPPDITEDPDVAVVFFKTSLNTGWDCPQAEVMMSYRRALDYTNIAQLVGRMVRAPLARRVDGDEQLNSVSLYLPHYDEAALQRVIAYLTESGEAAGAVDVETNPPVILKRAEGSEEAFAALGTIPSYVLPRSRKVSDVRRLVRLARNLSRDLVDPEANEREIAGLVAILVGEHGRLAEDDQYQSVIAERGTLTVRRVDWAVGEDETDEETFDLVVSPENVNDLFEAAGRRLGEGLHQAYWKTRVDTNAALLRSARLEIVALVARDDVNRKLAEFSRTRVRELLDAHAATVAALPERRRQVYDEIRRLSSVPELSSLQYPTEAIEVPPEETRWARHVFVDADGLAPFKLTTWEERVLTEELANLATVGWVRNMDRKKWALLVPYEVGGETKPLFPDFLFVRKVGDHLVVDILDPHNPDLGDAPAKAQGLAKFAQTHGPAFGRIEVIAEVGGILRRLDLKDETIRERVQAATTPAHLRALFS
jgi:type III restriction enzyme